MSQLFFVLFCFVSVVSHVRSQTARSKILATLKLLLIYILTGDFHFYQSPFPVKYLYFYSTMAFGYLIQDWSFYQLRMLIPGLNELRGSLVVVLLNPVCTVFSWAQGYIFNVSFTAVIVMLPRLLTHAQTVTHTITEGQISVKHVCNVDEHVNESIMYSNGLFVSVFELL